RPEGGSQGVSEMQHPAHAPSPGDFEEEKAKERVCGHGPEFFLYRSWLQLPGKVVGVPGIPGERHGYPDHEPVRSLLRFLSHLLGDLCTFCTPHLYLCEGDA